MQRNNYSSRLSRNEFYSYGFKEGESWGEDKRSLEAALHAMDNLERDIQRNYIEPRSSPYGVPAHAHPAAHAPSRQYPTIPTAHPSSSRYFHAGVPHYPTPDIRLARSTDSRSSASSSGSPRIQHGDWSSAGGQGYGGPVDRGQQQRERSSWQVADRLNSPVLHRSSGWAESYAQQHQQQQQQQHQQHQQQYYAPPPPPSISSRREHSSYRYERETPSRYYESRQNRSAAAPPVPPPQAPSRISSRHSSDARAQVMSPSQWQVSRVVDSRAAGYENDHDADGDPSYASPASPNWSTGTTHDTTSEGRQLSMTSSPGMYSNDGSASSEYTRSSGYVESFDVRSQCSDEHPGYDAYGEHAGYYYSSDEEGAVHGGGGGSDDGASYVSGEEIEYVYDDEEAGGSDGGYSDTGFDSDGQGYDSD